MTDSTSRAIGWLEGVRVLDLSQYLAGPVCTRMLVELGAEVTKVELPPHGDPYRGNSPRRNKRSGGHVQQNRGKRSVCIDFRAPEGLEILQALATRADVLVENFSPGVIGRFGLGYELLSKLNPRLIMASISGFGQTGPLSDRPCFDFVAQAYAGIMHMTGEPEGDPTFVGIALADSNAGVHAFAALGHALFHRERTGRGMHIDISMVDALFHMQESAVHSISMTDGTYNARRQGRNYQPLSPAGSFRAPDGWVVLLCGQPQMPAFWRALGHEDLADDPRFISNEARLTHRG